MTPEKSNTLGGLRLPNDETTEATVMRALLHVWSRIGGGRYQAILGAINWAAWDFPDGKPTVAILVTDQTFLRPINSATLSFEIFAGTPEAWRGRGLDPSLNGSFVRDCQEVVGDLAEARDPREGSLADGLFHNVLADAGIVQHVTDHNLNLQGIVAQFQVEY